MPLGVVPAGFVAHKRRILLCVCKIEDKTKYFRRGDSVSFSYKGRKTVIDRLLYTHIMSMK